MLYFRTHFVVWLMVLLVHNTQIIAARKLPQKRYYSDYIAICNVSFMEEILQGKINEGLS